MLKRLGVFAAAIAATVIVSVAGAASANAGVPILNPYPSPAACQQAQTQYRLSTGKSAFRTEGWDPGMGGGIARDAGGPAALARGSQEIRVSTMVSIRPAVLAGQGPLRDLPVAARRHLEDRTLAFLGQGLGDIDRPADRAR